MHFSELVIELVS